MKSTFIALCCIITTVLAVFSDEAFITDWKLRQIGPLDSDNILYPRQKILNLLTKTNTLAGISEGEVRWRVKFDDLLPDSKQNLVEFDGDVATALNYVDRSIIQVWDPIDGFLIKDLVSFDNKEIQSTHSTNGGSLVVFFQNGDVSIVNSDGIVSELSPISKSDEIKFSHFNNGNFIVLFRETGTENTHYGFFDGETLKTHTLQISWSSIREFHGTKLIYETIKHYALIFDLKTGDVSKPTPLANKFDKFIPINNDQLIAIETNHNIEILNLQTGAKLFQIPNVHKYELQYVDDVLILYTEYHINIIDSFSGDEIQSYFIGDVKIPYDQISSIKTSTDGLQDIHTLFEYANSTYSYWLNGQEVWTRDSSLSQVITHAIVDFEVETSLTTDDLIHEENLDLIQAYVFRITKHYKGMKNLYNSAWDALPSLFTSEYWKQVKPLENNEYFGFVKLLVLGTQSGRVVALNTLNGEQVWNFDTEQDDILHIETINNEKLYIFTKSGPRFELIAKTGELVEKKLIVSPQKVQHLYNETFYFEIENEFNVVLSEHETNNTNFIVKHDSKKIQGLKIQGKKVSTTWKFETNNDEEIIAFNSKDPLEKIANVGIVLGDRSVLYKYLYPNLAAFAVLNKPSQTLYIHIIDTITGELIHSTYHDEQVHLDEKVNIVFGEHWIIYSYWSNKPIPEQKIAVVDLFESLKSNERFSTSDDGDISSLEFRHPPAVSTKSFILPYKINSITLSKTRFGVTTKSIIISLQNGQILYLPKYILNPRRVENRELTSEEKSEFMLFPYDPIISINDDFVISHHRQVIGADTLVSIPTNLESTSIVCSYGLDVFCTRISPSTQFDKLTSSFDKVKLVLSIILLIITLLILKPLKDSRNLKSLWVIES